jgi:site-specific recombinase XerD
MARKRLQSSPGQQELVLRDVVEVRDPGQPKLAPLAAVDAELLPPILVNHGTPAAAAKVRKFYLSVAELFERWVTRRESPNTQRAYRNDVTALLEFLAIDWPREGMKLFTVTVGDVQRWRDWMIEQEYAPKTINRRVSSFSSLYKYLQGSAAEMRLPITVPNPAHAQFIARSSTDAVKDTAALSPTRARQLMGLADGEELIDYRDRALIKLFLFSAIRIGAACKLNVGDFRNEEDSAVIRITEKGDKRRSIGIHPQAASAIAEYIEMAEITRGPLFRPRKGPRNSTELANRHLASNTMYLILMSYLERLPGAMKTVETEQGTYRECIYSPHSLRATCATRLLDLGVDIAKVQELLGHRHITTTQVYDKRRRSTLESASHDVAY